MRILLLSRYCRKGASSRLRSLQYLPLLERHGIHVDVHFLYDETYLDNLYTRRRRDPGNLLSCYLRRIKALSLLDRYDAVWLEQEIFPWFPQVAEALVHRLKLPYVVDFDDAIFHRYDRHPNPLVRRLLGDKIDRIMQKAALVTVGNGYLADRARRAGASRIEIIPTVVDLNRYSEKDAERSEKLTIGWIGSPATYDYFLEITPLLIEMMQEHPLQVSVIGVVDEAANDLPFAFHPWAEETEVEALQSLDVGIMPLPDSPWTRGKCGYKLIQYMACGIPVVASSVGANIDIIANGRNGFLVSSPGEWIEAIKFLFDHPQARRRMGRLARKTVEQRYHLGITGPQLAALFGEIDGQRRSFRKRRALLRNR